MAKCFETDMCAVKSFVTSTGEGVALLFIELTETLECESSDCNLTFVPPFALVPLTGNEFGGKLFDFVDDVSLSLLLVVSSDDVHVVVDISLVMLMLV